MKFRSTEISLLKNLRETNQTIDRHIASGKTLHQSRTTSMAPLIYASVWLDLDR